MEYINLLDKEGRKLRTNTDRINPIKEEIEEFIESEPLLKKTKFTSQIPKDIQSNNIIESYADDIETIKELIGRKLVYDMLFGIEKKGNTEEEKRINNLYNAYSFINERRPITKENLRELYRRISDGLICEEDLKYMGEYYREDEVCITNTAYFDDKITGVSARKVETYVDYLLEFIKEAKAKQYTDSFIISQIIHYYMVFIHPYFDCNGRTSRTTAMWYLLNNKANAFLNFNRSIPFTKGQYNKSINMTRDTSDLTHFLKYMLDMEKRQLEKEYIIASIERSRGKAFGDDDYIFLEYFLSNSADQNLLTLINQFSRVSGHKFKPAEIREKLEPFTRSGLIIQIGTTSKGLSDGTNNPVLRLNRDVIPELDLSKITRLKTENYFNK